MTGATLKECHNENPPIQRHQLTPEFRVYGYKLEEPELERK